jgi:hypothetical protein
MKTKTKKFSFTFKDLREAYMKHNHLSKIFCLAILSFLLITEAVQAKTVKSKYTDVVTTYNVQYGRPDSPDSFSVKIDGVNKLDYEYSVKMLYELPKPHRFEFPSPVFSIQGEKCNIAGINNKLQERLTKFGQDDITKWYDEVENMGCTIKFGDPNGAGHLIIEEGDILEEMRKTKPGGAIVITITAKPKKWELESDGTWKYEGKVVELENLELAIGSDIEKNVKQHLEPRTIRFNFSGPKGITFSIGPYLSFLNRNIHGRIKNPEYEENSNDAEKKDKYKIGLTEESKNIYGIAVFWNAPFGTFSKGNIDWGVCWGVAYNMQDKLDKGVSGLLGFYFKPKKSPALIHLGAAVGQAEGLADGYDIGTAIGENEEIPVKTKLAIDFFFSLSFSF